MLHALSVLKGFGHLNTKTIIAQAFIEEGDALNVPIYYRYLIELGERKPHTCRIFEEGKTSLVAFEPLICCFQCLLSTFKTVTVVCEVRSKL